MSSSCSFKSLFSTLLTVSVCMAAPAFAAPPSASAAVVNTSIAKAGTFKDAYTAVGTVAAHQGVQVSSEVSGRVVAVHAKSGKWVKQGAVLVQLNPAVLKGSLIQKDAQMKLAKRQFQRTEKLFHDRTVSKSVYDQAKATYLESMGAFSQTRAQLDQTTIRAPFSGFLGLTNVHVGDFVTAGQMLAPLQAVDPVWVNFKVPQSLMHAVKVGQRVSVEVNTYPHKAFKGHVIATDAQLNAESRELGVRAALPNPKRMLTPGAYVSVQLQYGKSHPVIVIPETAVMYEALGNYVYVVRKGKAEKTFIEIDASTAGSAMIRKGLHPGDVVVSAGQVKISDGASVKGVPLK